MFALIVALAATTTAPLAVRVELAPLGRGTTGTVVGVAVQVAPEDRPRAGERVKVTVTLLKGGRVIDRGSGVVDLAPDGTALLYREWPTGEAEVRVVVEAVGGDALGGWVGPLVVPTMETRFEPPSDAPADALALGLSHPPAEGVRFRPPGQIGGIGALQLEVEVPEGTARVLFSQDGRDLFVRNRPPWTVSVPLGEVARRSTVRAVASDASGAILGEAAFVINAPAHQLAVEIAVRPGSGAASDTSTVTISVSGAKTPNEVRLSLGGKLAARWDACPCVVKLASQELGQAAVLTAEAIAADGTRGEAIYVVGQGSFVEHVRVDKVELPVVVVDAGGEPVPALARDAFRVFEDGVEVEIEGFGTTADLPLALGLAVDVSGSMEQRWKEVREAVAGFAKRLLRPGDESFLLTFSWDARVERPWSGDPRAIEDSLDALRPEGGTSLHDALVHALEAFRGRRGRTALVILTDGEDTTSRTGWDVALRYARSARVPIYPIGLRIGKLDFLLRGRLRDLAEATGGEGFFPSNTEGLNQAYDEISRQLRTQYLLSYVSPSSGKPEQFRTVRVEVKGEGRSARTIAGYFPAE